MQAPVDQIPVGHDDSTTCARCGTPNSTVARFCGACGTRLLLFCWSCGTPATVGQPFCRACGVGLVLPTDAEPQHLPAPGRGVRGADPSFAHGRARAGAWRDRGRVGAPGSRAARGSADPLQGADGARAGPRLGFPDVDEAIRAETLEALEIAQATGSTVAENTARGILGAGLVLLGEWGAAEIELRRSAGQATTLLGVSAIYEWWLMRLLTLRGDLQTAADQMTI